MKSYAKIVTLENEFEAQLLQSVLAERGIEYYFKSFYDAAYDGLFQKNYGWGAVFAPEKFRREITEIVKDIRSNPVGL